jgi:divalent metal cation (Fe/Co/Zn/Cd) transporter
VALGYPWADAAAALVVAVFIGIAGYRLGRRTIDTLTDTAPAGVSELVAAIARQVPGIVAVERVRVRPAGAVLFVELGVSVSRTAPLHRVTMIKEQLSRAIRAELPAARW